MMDPNKSLNNAIYTRTPINLFPILSHSYFMLFEDYLFGTLSINIALDYYLQLEFHAKMDDIIFAST